ncbi:MAG: hypothetical protein K8S16_15255, partial [Bacteroidales bacterium]|nr:hypothetical protein [Bacteroidales bacterium]
MKTLKSLFVFGIIFSFLNLSAEDYFWFGGQGEWSDLNSWQTSSGLIPLTIPDAGDNVIFNENSFINPFDTVFIYTNNPVCLSMTWTNISDTVVLAGGTGNSSFNIYGSATLHSKIKNEYYGAIRFLSSEAGNTISCAKSKFSGSIYFDGFGEWILQDTLFVYDSTDWKAVIFDDSVTNFVKPQIFHTNGTLNTNEQTVICRGFRTDGSQPRVLIANNTDFYLDGNWYLKGTPLTMSSENLNITIRGKMENLSGDIVYYNDITFLPQFGILHIGLAANIFENTGIRTDIRKVHYLCSGTMDGMKQINNPGFFTIDTL